MVTNLSGFPSALTVVPVPEGNIIKHRVDFVVNENLKRMGCSGRAGLHLSPPIDATLATFMRLYKTSDRVPIYSSVIELVKLCQVALIFYNKLAPEYADGLLCDLTEQAINDWWSDIGTEFFNTDPTDGILGPTTVAALLGTLLGARNRLAVYGAPVAKDVFDLTSTKRGIASFQKSQKLERTRRFDRQTLDRLHRVTAKAVSCQGWTVPRAVKSTVAELSGKGGHIVMGMVVGIAEIETLDIDTFVQLAYGERCKWLWHGKPLKGNDAELFNNGLAEDSILFGNDDHGGYTWSSSRRDSGIDDNSRPGVTDRTYNLSTHGSQINLDPTMKDTAPRRTVLKSVTERMTDARSGLGRIKEAVGKTGRRGHYHKHSKDENPASDGESIKETRSTTQPQHFGDKWTPSQETKPAIVTEEPAYLVYPGRGGSITDDLPEAQKCTQTTALEKKTPEIDVDSVSSLDGGPRNLRPEVHSVNHIHIMRQKDCYSTPSLDSINLAQPSDTSKIWPRSKGRNHFAPEIHRPLLLQRTKSLSHLPADTQNSSSEARWPRHLSFSAVVDVVAAGVDTASLDDIATRKSLDALAAEDHLTMWARHLTTQLQDLSACDGSWVERRVGDVHELDAQYGKDQESLNQLYHQKLEEYNGLRGVSDQRVAEKTASVADTIKEIENLGAKLEYELTALQLKIKDVENGATEFERQVLEIESRAEELREETRDRPSWLSWPWRIFAGITQPVE